MYGWLAVATVLLYLMLRAALPDGQRWDRRAWMSKRERCFNVYRRDDQWKALSFSKRAGFAAGFCFSFLFYISLPFFIWRYGILRTIVLFLIPVLGAIAIATVLGLDPLASVFMIVPFQALIALWIAAHDFEFRCKLLADKGWVHIGCGWASKSSDALHTFSMSPLH